MQGFWPIQSPSYLFMVFSVFNDFFDRTVPVLERVADVEVKLSGALAGPPVDLLAVIDAERPDRRMIPESRSIGRPQVVEPDPLVHPDVPRIGEDLSLIHISEPTRH